MRRSAASIVLAALLVHGLPPCIASRAARRIQERCRAFSTTTRCSVPAAQANLPLVYRNPKAQWTAYRKVILEPVTLVAKAAAPLPSMPLRSETCSTSYRSSRPPPDDVLGRGFELVEKAVARLRCSYGLRPSTEATPQPIRSSMC